MRYSYESGVIYPIVNMDYDTYKEAADKIRKFHRSEIKTWSGFWRCNYQIYNHLRYSHGLSDEEAEEFTYQYMQPYFQKLSKSELDKGYFGDTDAIINKCSYKRKKSKQKKRWF